jgi:flagellar biosynthesis protein FlhA
LRERIPIRDLEAILETLGDWSAHTKDIDVLTEYVRNTLRRTISNLYAEPDENGANRLFCVTLDPEVTDLINGYIDRGPSGTTMSIPPQVANRIAAAVAKTAEPLMAAGHQLVVLTAPTVRAQLRQILDPQIPGAAVLSYNEIVDDLDVESMGLVQVPQLAGVGAA